MKKTLNIILVLFAVALSAQTALYNNGNLRIHEGGSIGFHTHLINESPLDNNLGLAGFYGTQLLTVSGTLTPQFYDVEIALENDLQLALGIDNSNNTNFILGNIRTPLTQPSIYYTFLDNSFYTGENDFSKIEGYAAITNQIDFAFPIGDSQFLRPLIINSESVNLFAKSAYFFEDANNPISFSNTFDTSEKDLDIESVNTSEFWRLEGTITSNVTLSWNPRSAMAGLTDDATTIIPVGWSKNSQRWINLVGSTPVGSLNEGFITTTSFIPDDYEIITLGASKAPYEPLSKDVINLDNFFVSVNGDGINDSFYVAELEEYDSNFVQIYDRYGLKVFEMANYTDEFNGFSNLNNIPFGAEKGLPVGVYFYTIDLPGEDLSFQGFLYLAR
ncbi:MAG: gliding motility-associated C-terminal domain-containing protein [Maribacter arcticus]|uniref:gliding motility-associated C-terminal domain-containing protein n=1 Tax=Maribacter arcticus TaxID=561365 RepID=UPI003002E4AF